MILSKSANLNVRIESDIKENAEDILNNLGLSASTAINIFYRQIIEHNGLPFEVRQHGDVTNFSKEAIYREIDKGLKSYLEGRVTPAELIFEELDQEYKSDL